MGRSRVVEGRSQHWADVLADALASVSSFMLAARLPLSEATAGGFAVASPGLLGGWAGAQVAAMWLAGVYAARSTPGTLLRLAAGGLLGTAVAAYASEALFDAHPASPAFHLTDLVLLLAGTAVWRAVRVGWTARRRGPGPADAAFVDRTTEQVLPLEMLASLVRYRGLLANLVRRDLKLKYRGSVLGFMWSLVHPLALMLAYTLAFKYFLRTGPPNYAFFVLVGLLGWSFFANSANMSTNAMIESAGLLKAVRFPRAILPVSVVLFNLTQYLLTMLVFLPLLFLLYGQEPAAPMLAFPAVLLLQVVFTTGVALALSVITVFFRDIRHLVDVSLPIMFWTTPVLYSLDQITGPPRTLIELSPLSSYVTAYQRIFYQGLWPEFATWVMGGLYAVAALAVGALLFYALEDAVGEQL